MFNLSELPKTLFSPFKLMFVGYVVLVAIGKIDVSGFWEFFGISIIIMIFEIGHNDFLRIVLNNQADKKKGE